LLDVFIFLIAMGWLMGDALMLFEAM